MTLSWLIKLFSPDPFEEPLANAHRFQLVHRDEMDNPPDYAQQADSNKPANPRIPSTDYTRTISDKETLS